jgi:2'-hydroxyisoflavone reductase
LFNRGKTNSHLFPGVEKLRGDRRGDLTALEGREWDVVLDNSGYFPADVTRSASLLAPHVKQYIFVSSISAYARMDTPGMNEDAPLATTDDADATQITGANYGGLKALCEQAAEAAMPGRTTIIRPGLIVGPGDHTDRFTYWPVRVARGGEVLCPGSADDPTQFIDVRDLVAFELKMAEEHQFRTFTADAHEDRIRMGGLLQACQQAAPKAVGAIQCVRAPCPQPDLHPSTLTWVPAEFLEQQGVAPWGDMPVWLPAPGDSGGFGRLSTARARAAGLSYRTLQDTVGDTLAWWNAQPDERREKLRAGISPEREAAVLAAWKQHNSAAG